MSSSDRLELVSDKHDMTINILKIKTSKHCHAWGMRSGTLCFVNCCLVVGCVCLCHMILTLDSFCIYGYITFTFDFLPLNIGNGNRQAQSNYYYLPLHKPNWRKKKLPPRSHFTSMLLDPNKNTQNMTESAHTVMGAARAFR